MCSWRPPACDTRDPAQPTVCVRLILLVWLQAGVNATILMLTAGAAPAPLIISTQLAAGDIAQTRPSSNFSVSCYSFVPVSTLWIWWGCMPDPRQSSSVYCSKQPTQLGNAACFGCAADQQARQAAAADQRSGADRLSARRGRCCSAGAAPCCHPGSQCLLVVFKCRLDRVSKP